MRRQCSDQHQRALQQLGNAGAIGFDARCAVLLEAAQRTGEQPHALQEVVQQQRLADIQLEVAAGSGPAHRHVVAKNLPADHQQRLALGRVDLARHDRTAGLVGRNHDLAQPAAWPRGEPAHVVRNLHQARRQPPQRAVRMHHRIVRGQRFELIRRRVEILAGQAAQFAGHAHRKFSMGVQAGAHCRAANGQLAQMRQRRNNMGLAVAQLGRPARNLLPQRQRRGVLQVRAADLDNVGEQRCLVLQRCRQAAQGGQQVAAQRQHSGHVERGWHHIVARLAEVDVVIRMHQPVLALRPAQAHRCQVGQHLVHVHVALGARAGLPNRQRKLAVVLTRTHLVGGLDDGVYLGRIQQAECFIDHGGGAFRQRQGMQEFGGHALGGNREIQQGALGLRAPMSLGRHGHIAHRVVFDTVLN